MLVNLPSCASTDRKVTGIFILDINVLCNSLQITYFKTSSNILDYIFILASKYFMFNIPAFMESPIK
jgi:hypothetical protein